MVWYANLLGVHRWIFGVVVADANYATTFSTNSCFPITKMTKYHIAVFKHNTESIVITVNKNEIETQLKTIKRGNQPVALLRCNEDQVTLIAAFRSSALLGLVSLIFLLTIPHWFSIGFRPGEFAGQSSTVTSWSLNQLLVPLAVCAGDKSCWKMKSASP